jgi:hypothetical protein
MSLHQGLAVVEEAEPPISVILELGRVHLECGVEAVACQLDVRLGAVACIFHCHCVHRHAMCPVMGVGLGHHDVLQLAHSRGPCSSCHINKLFMFVFHILAGKI